MGRVDARAFKLRCLPLLTGWDRAKRFKRARHDSRSEACGLDDIAWYERGAAQFAKED